MKRKFSGERLETSIYDRNAIEHIHRYAIVKNYIQDKIVLDIACGEGYGSNIISRTAKLVYGVDIDSETIKHASSKYKSQNLKFLCGSTSNIPLEDNSVDVVVSFETIEHHDKHEEMLQEIKRVLKKNGVIIISTPDKLYYTDERQFNNSFHIKELYKKDFNDLISRNFKTKQLLTQSYINRTSYIKNDLVDAEFYRGNYSDTSMVNIRPLYLIAIASDYEFNMQKDSIFDGSEIISDTLNYVYSSNSYKLGHFILKPLKFFKKTFN